jgi:NADH-quinone oxidoreductase subunit J
MIVQAIFFYIFAFACVASAVMVVVGRNPVHSVLFLILAFVNAAGLFVMLGAEFLAMILVVVYVGAVAVLFLFVVMMLDVDFAELRRGVQQYLPLGLVLGVVFLFELAAIVIAELIGTNVTKAVTTPTPPLEQMSNTQALAQVLYTRYVYFFEGAGLVLLVAMIGAIVLTLRHKPQVKRQDITRQIARTKATAIDIVKVKSGEGVS